MAASPAPRSRRPPLSAVHKIRKWPFADRHKLAECRNRSHAIDRRIETLFDRLMKLAFAVRDRWPPVAIIIASGRIRPQPDEMPTDVAFLRKPYSEASVLQAVRQAA
ncbi:hypothetical protein [Bosea lathyri]|uniref:hypothetical protein n=1 Tax=Bosea lathyri TaxID=1036778 RepID=UPI0011B05B93|nr:hypothetical protein [Bosea lathyri]